MGLPGIYWFTYLGKDALQMLDVEALRPFKDLEFLVDDFDRIAWLTYPTPDAETAALRREREAACVAVLGSDYFFDLTKAAASSTSTEEAHSKRH